MTWRIDTPGTDPDNRRERGTEAEALTLADELVRGGAQQVVVWEMGPVEEAVEAPETRATGAVSASDRLRVLRAAAPAIRAAADFERQMAKVRDAINQRSAT